MKKHIFAFICVFVILFNTLSFKEAHAMDIGVAIDVGSDILYQGWDMINSILNGAIISFSPYTQYADKAAAMGAFYNDWGNILEQLTGGNLEQEAAISLDTVYPLDYGMSYDTMNYFIDEYGRIVDQAPSDPYYFPMLISPETYAQWNRYQNNWIGKYIDLFQPEVDIPVANPDPIYLGYLNMVNAKDDSNPNYFWFYDCPSVVSKYTLYKYPVSNYTWYSSSAIQNDFNATSIYNCLNLVDLHIYSYNDAYAVYYSGSSLNNIISEPGFYYSRLRFTYQNNGYVLYPHNMNGASETITYSYNGTLSEVLFDITKHFKNANIYVNDELWSLAGNFTIPDSVVDAPDVIRLGEDGPVIKNDVYIPEQDLYVDLIGWTNLVDDHILEGDSIGFDDLIDAGVLTDAEGNIITDENRDEYFKKRDIAAVITDELVDADLDNLLPPAPSPPDDDPSNWHFPTIVIPDGGDPDPKHTGLSILARIVNVTNQSMPAEVMTMFWGICITLVILGIIKILHK